MQGSTSATVKFFFFRQKPLLRLTIMAPNDNQNIVGDIMIFLWLRSYGKRAAVRDDY